MPSKSKAYYGKRLSGTRLEYNKYYEKRDISVRRAHDELTLAFQKEMAVRSKHNITSRRWEYTTASKQWENMAKKKATKKQVAPPPLPKGAGSLAYINPGDDGGAACRNPNCPTCQRIRESEAIALPKFYTGQRVDVVGISPERTVTATVINLDPAKRPEDCVAVCLDSPIPNAEVLLERIAGHGHGKFVEIRRVLIRDDQHSFEAFQQMPSHIGVTVVDGRKIDSINFKNGMVGKIVRQRGYPGERALVNWNFNNRHLYDGATEDYDGVGFVGMFTSCYNVPYNMLAYCRLNQDRNRAQVIWPTSGPQTKIEDFKEGDYVRVTIADPQRVSNGIRNFRISPGAIMRYQGPLDRHKSQATLAGGCDPAILGITATINTKGLEKLEGDFIEASAEVEIVADLSFRKRTLKGLRAVVVLPLDQDGDVGLQFKEDIGAGSLDGHGQDLRCLYIHQSGVKKVSG